MSRPRKTLRRLVVAVLCLGMPTLAAALTNTEVTDRESEHPPLGLTPDGRSAPQAKPGAPSAVSANPLWAVPLSALTETRDRPLFSPSRRAPAAAVTYAPVVARPPPPHPSVAEHPNLILVGTVAGNSDGIAVFIDKSTRATVRLRTGEGHLGWILQSVEPRTATLQKDGQSEILELPHPAAVQQ